MARRRRLGEVLVVDGIISQDDLTRALEAQGAGEGPRQRLGKTLIELGFVKEEDLARALGQQLGLQVVDLAKHPPSPAATSRLPSDVARNHMLVPFEVKPDGTLIVAMVDPTNIVALDELRMTTGAPRVRPVVAAESVVRAALDHFYPINGSGDRHLISLDAYEQEEEGEEGRDNVDAKPIVRLANSLVVDAMRMRASDVHVEPTRGAVRIRFRVDGMLTEVMQVPRAAFAPLISRLKLMAGMDIAERRRPQDGRMAMVVQGEAVDVRVSAMPAMHGEKLVMRLLHRGAAQMGLEELNLAPDLLELIKETAESLQGIVLVTGPTGSGKTTSVYATLAELATITRNVITLEDPIEYELELVNQTQVNPQIGFTFAMGMRTVLRQDPDVLMVGEIRDLETAELAFEAAMTGHLVLSTVHTNDAPATIIRMSELGVERHLIASSLSLVLAQRLVRLVCEDCAGPDVAIPNERAMRRLRLSHEHLEGHNRRVGAGCTRCSWTGFRGRAAVIEALRVTPHIRELITDHASEEEVREYACSEGMRSMRQDGLIKAMKGMTTLEEVLRATPDDPRLDMPALLAHLGAGGDGLRTFRINRHTEPSRTPDR